jgi:hypothetical protein
MSTRLKIVFKDLNQFFHWENWPDTSLETQDESLKPFPSVPVCGLRPVADGSVSLEVTDYPFSWWREAQTMGTSVRNRGTVSIHCRKYKMLLPVSKKKDFLKLGNFFLSQGVRLNSISLLFLLFIKSQSWKTWGGLENVPIKSATHSKDLWTLGLGRKLPL